MASVLRHIVASNRVKHEGTGLDLCYVTSNLLATSGPSQTYPRLAYRNPLDRLVAFLDAKHGNNWAIWEFRAEGTGYPDDAVYNRIRHYPWPDHHPPPFALVPLIVASMRNWIDGGGLDGGSGEGTRREGEGKRVVVVHCKAGKGRSGTMACSYLISECGWTAEDALARFTERRMRPGYGSGVSIPSQLRWVGYVDRWANANGGSRKRYVDLPVEIVEIHVWGLRHGVKLAVEGYEDEGKRIKVFHTFRHDERIVVEGDAPGGGGVVDLVSDMAGYIAGKGEEGQVGEGMGDGGLREDDDDGSDVNKTGDKTSLERSSSKKSRASSLLRKVSKRIPHSGGGSGPSNTLPDGRGKARTIAIPEASQVVCSATPTPNTKLSGDQQQPQSQSQSQSTTSLRSSSISFADEAEPGGQAVIFKPATPIRIPNSDVNIVIERRNRVRASKMLTMVTSVAHTWFNAYFEGNGPEQDGRPDDSGVFEIEWEGLDGIKGSRQRGTRACDRLSVVWRFAGMGTGRDGVVKGGQGEVVDEPGGHAPVPQMRPADWKGGNDEDPTGGMHLGLRVADPESASISRASSVKSVAVDGGDNGKDKEVKGGEGVDNNDGLLEEGVRVSGPAGEDVLDDDDEIKGVSSSSSSLKKKEDKGMAGKDGKLFLSRE